MVNFLPTVPSGAQVAFAIGDSIAVGLNSVFAPSLNVAADTSRLQGAVIAHVGLGCSAVLGNINSLVAGSPNALSGKIVALSCGGSNSPAAADVNKTFNQIEAIQNAGGLPVLVGVSQTYNLFGVRGSDINIALQHLAAARGVPFADGYAAGPDNIHPKSYQALAQQVRTALIIAHPIASPPDISGSHAAVNAPTTQIPVVAPPSGADAQPSVGAPQITGLTKEDAVQVLAAIFTAGGRAMMVETPQGSGVFAIFNTGAPAPANTGAAGPGIPTDTGQGTSAPDVGPATAPSSGFDRKAFFDGVRADPFGGSLNQGQVDGMTSILDEWEKRLPPNSDPRWLAYMLGTTFHETARTMQPIEEFGHGHGRPYGTPTPPYGQVYYGRGFVQLTWQTNYVSATQKLRQHGVIGNDVDLERDPALAMRSDIASAVLIFGMIEGWFTSRKLGDYFGPGKDDWLHARQIINGMDRAQQIADYGHAFQRAITAGFHQ